MVKTIFEKTMIPLLTKSLDAAVLRQRSTAGNIANVTTVGYRRTEVSFEDKLRKASHRWRVKGTRSHQTHMSTGRRNADSVTPEIIRPDDTTAPSGINNVDIDQEMGTLAQNQLRYQLYMRLMKKRFNGLRTSIRGRQTA